MISEPVSNRERTGKHMVTPIAFKAHKVSWLSAELIEDNFENHYGAEVRHLNTMSSNAAGRVDLPTGGCGSPAANRNATA
jgi:hypothetical protein